jgi:DNA-binding GntR family transcriptional regulator
MELVRVDTERAYQRIREKIIVLDLPPGAIIDEGQLADELGMGLVPVREALKLLAHDHLVDVSPKGIFVSDVNITDLEQISELRLLLEAYCARQAAKNASADDLVVLEALCQEQASISPEQHERLFDLDHKFHQAIARAARNHYLTSILDDFFGLSQRLWYMVLPHLEFLPAAVEKHLDLVEAIRNRDVDRAETIMRSHVEEFYDQVHHILMNPQVK